MKVNGAKVNTKSIESFQINGDYYQNVYKRTFARRIHKGPINIYQNTSENTTTVSSTGSMSSHTWNTDHYYLQKPGIDKGSLYQIDAFGKQSKLPLYIKGYRPTIDIYNKYRSERHMSRIVKLATIGFWLSSIPILIATKPESPLHDFAAYNAFAGIFYTPIMAFTFKSCNHARPFEAVQQYIDNVYVENDLKPANAI